MHINQDRGKNYKLIKPVWLFPNEIDNLDNQSPFGRTFYKKK